MAGEQLCFEDLHRQQAKHEPTACPRSKGGPWHPQLHLQEQSQYIIGSGYCPLLDTHYAISRWLLRRWSQTHCKGAWQRIKDNMCKQKQEILNDRKKNISNVKRAIGTGCPERSSSLHHSIPKGAALESKRTQESWLFFKDSSLKAREQFNFNVQNVEPAWKKASMGEQGPPDRVPISKRITQEEKVRRIQGHCPVVQEWNKKSQSSTGIEAMRGYEEQEGLL
ncbi:hypothetical protein QYF61_005148 [Mycteria americana]|uniref:Uncharacterized protein n=1 Tax=Mycteria americana TaxID=33587 RepID=A0AAN7NS53_MYCAM|nr:hypothetical protein QYF61_005148 [Mycteria americana]